MKARLILLSFGLIALTILSLGRAQEPKSALPQDKDEIITNEQQLARQFADFQDALLRLKQRLARGTPEEKKRAELLGKVLDECKNLAINQEFTKMIEILRTADIQNTGGVLQIREQSDLLTTRLRRILDLIQNSNSDRLSQERKDLEQLLKDLQKAIDKQKIVEAITAQKKTDAKELQDNQKKVTEDTKKVEEGIGKYLDKDGKGAEAANLKGEKKDGGKNDGAKGEAKDAGEKAKAGAKGETKDAGKDSQGAKGEAKAADPKGNPGEKSPDAEPKAGSKTGDKGKEGSPKAGAKDDKSGAKGEQGAAKDNKGDEKSKGQEVAAKDAGPKSGDPMKKDGAQGAAKGGDDKKAGGEKSKSGGAPDSQAKPGAKAGGEPKTGSAKEAKGGDAKGGEAKSGDAKGGDGKQGEAKSGDSKSGQGQAKDGGAAPSPGSPSPSPPQAGQKGDGGSPPPPNAGNKQNDDVAKSQKKLEEAGYDQVQAEKKIGDGDNKEANKKQADAIAKMEAAKKQLEKLLQQMREEELERVLAALQARCEKMLMMQMQVLAGTEDTFKVIQRNADKKPDRNNKLEALKLSDREKDIVQEANKCIDILEAEGSAVAFPEVFQQVRQDMIHVQKRLELTDVADVTQGIERDIIDTLKEMIEALKKARQDNQNDPSQSKPGQAGKPGDQKLLELIQELKMVRSLQKRINDRTVDRAKRFPGEQASDPQIVRELRNLAERQQRIQDIVSRIAKGDNK